jgi:carbonic anhydrase
MQLPLKVFIWMFCYLAIFNLGFSQEKNLPIQGFIPMPDQNQINTTLNYARGHQVFRDLYFKQHEQEFVRLVQEGQYPHTLFIGCSDSRVLPDLIIAARPGDLFVVRTAGNFVPFYDRNNDDGVSATIQYAIEVLGIKDIIVCGHSHCGAIRGLFEELNPDTLGILKRWLRYGEDAKRMTLLTIKPTTSKEEKLETAEKLSVIYQLEHLMSFPFIRQRVQQETLTLHGWYYKIETGEIEYYDPQLYAFKPLILTEQKKEKAPK